VNSAGFDPHPRNRRLLLIFLASFLVRAFIAVPVIVNDTRPKFDESSYFRRAVAMRSILGDLVRLRSPRGEDVDVFYTKGAWPPFQPLVLSSGMLLSGESVAAARVMMIILSSLTTVLVFLVTDRLAGPKAGWMGSFLHLGYPSFLAFSHYLWSETTYIFLLFLALYLALQIPECPSAPRRTRLSILLGLNLGCLALTRSAGLAPVFLIPAWIFLRTRLPRAKIVSPIMILVTALITIFPWEYALFQREHRFVLISNYNYRNLYQGQYPRQGSEDGDADVDPGELLSRSLSDHMRERSVSVEIAAKELAMKEILSRPWAFLSGGIGKFICLWTFDSFPLRHAVNAVYPPMPNAAVMLLILVFTVSAVALYWLALKGLLINGDRFKDKALILALILGGAMPYALAFGHSRFNLPQIALLLPIAAFGLAHFKEKTKGFVPASILVVVGSGILFYRSYSGQVHQTLRPSSWYSGPIVSLDRAFGTRSLFGDEFVMRGPEPNYADTLTVTIVDDDGNAYSFNPREPLKQLVIRKGPVRGTIRFTVYGHRPQNPIELRIFSKKLDRGVRVNPVDPSYWNRFSAIGLDGLELNWKGGR